MIRWAAIENIALMLVIAGVMVYTRPAWYVWVLGVLVYCMCANVYKAPKQ